MTISKRLRRYLLLFGLTAMALDTSANAETIYSKDREARTWDQGHHIWAQNIKINKNANTIRYESGADAKECVPTGDNGAWLSIVLYSRDDKPIATYDNVDVVNVENAKNVMRHKAVLSNVEKDDLDEAAYFLPIMRGTAGCN
jgi:hypothetical protein